MKLEITTTKKKIIATNYILAQAINTLKENPNARETYNITEKEVEEAERFREQMIKALNKSKQ